MYIYIIFNYLTNYLNIYFDKLKELKIYYINNSQFLPNSIRSKFRSSLLIIFNN